jgi:hypothetical protein
MEARARAITEQKEQRQRDKSPGPGIRHRRDKSTDGSVGRFPVIASPRPDGGHRRDISGVSGLPSATMAAKRSSLEVPGSNESSPIQQRHQNPTERNAAARDSNTNATITNGHHNATSSLDQINASPGMDLPAAFSGGGPGPHIPPPLDDTDHDASDESPSSVPASAEDGGSRPGSLKRQERKPVGVARAVGASGSLSRRLAAGTSGGGEESHPTESRGVQLSDRPMDDFS